MRQQLLGLILLIASWNVNSVKARLTNVLDWLAEAKPDVVLLQEIKCQDDGFPTLDFQSAGYTAAVHGQKSYNGVAILSRLPMSDIRTGLPGDAEDTQARWIEAKINGVQIASLYLPNGNPNPGEKFDYKLRWMDRLIAHGHQMLKSEMPVVLGGDYNICPMDRDVYDPKNWQDDALCDPQSRARFRRLLNMGYWEAFTALHPDHERAWTFWDYQAGAWPRDLGLRIDHFLLSPQAADKLQDCRIDRDPRAKEKASDHTPILVQLHPC